MSYASDRVIHDADSHIMEPLQWLDALVDPAHISQVQGLIKTPQRIQEMIEQATNLRSNAEAFKSAREQPISGPKGWSAYGAWDGQERAEVMDRLGFASQLVFPTFGLRPLQATSDVNLKYVLARAYNQAILAFCADPRLIAVGYVPLEDPQRAHLEACQAIAEGCGAILLSASAAGTRSPGHTDFDPLWQALSDRKVPFVLHIGAGTITQPKEFHNNGRERAPDIHGGGENLRFCDYTMLWYAPQMFLSSLIYDGVFERFPLLRGGVIESAAGWVPEFLRQLDHAYRAFSRTDPYLQALPLKPSEYIRRAVKFTPFPNEDVGRMIRDAGSELFLFSSDYPHPEGTDDPLGRFEASLHNIPETDLDMFYRKNFEYMLGMHGSV